MVEAIRRMNETFAELGEWATPLWQALGAISLICLLALPVAVMLWLAFALHPLMGLFALGWMVWYVVLSLATPEDDRG